MEEKYYMWYCPICAKNKKDLEGAIYHVHGYINESTFVVNNGKCLQGHDAIQLSMPCEDYEILTHISTDPDFMDKMVKLHDDDIIEYNLKMSQFKTSLSQTQSAQEDNNKVKCPKCHSTQITTGARGVKHFWGLIGASKTVNRCAKCGHTWKP